MKAELCCHALGFAQGAAWAALTNKDTALGGKNLFWFGLKGTVLRPSDYSSKMPRTDYYYQIPQSKHGLLNRQGPNHHHDTMIMAGGALYQQSSRMKS